MPRHLLSRSSEHLPYILIFGLLLPLLGACSGGGGGNGGDNLVADNGPAPSTAARTRQLMSNDPDCPNGGIEVQTGIDENKNGLLDDNEVDNTQKVCNGEDGIDGADGTGALVKMSLEPAGANCPYKGIRIDSGQDANGNGQLDAGEIADTQYICNLIDGQIGWQVATLIETDNAGNASWPQIAVDDNGNAIAVWHQSDGTRRNIWANRYVPGTGWGNAELIETDNAGDALYPQTAMDDNGNAIAVWQQSDGTRYNIWANRYVPGTGWGNAELIETDNAESASFPQIAVDANGNAIAVWHQSDGTRDNIWANRYVPGTGWGNAKLIETDSTGSALNPQIAVDANGNAIAVWDQSDGTRRNIWANHYLPGFGWGTAELIETDNAGDAASPQIAVDANGNAIAVWYQSDGTRDNIWANRWLAP